MILHKIYRLLLRTEYFKEGKKSFICKLKGSGTFLFPEVTFDFQVTEITWKSILHWIFVNLHLSSRPVTLFLFKKVHFLSNFPHCIQVFLIHVAEINSLYKLALRSIFQWNSCNLWSIIWVSLLQMTYTPNSFAPKFRMGFGMWVLVWIF